MPHTDKVAVRKAIRNLSLTLAAGVFFTILVMTGGC